MTYIKITCKLRKHGVMSAISIQIIFSFHSDSIHVLRAADLYFTQAVTDTKSDVLSEDRLLEIYSFLQNNLSSPQSQASLLYQNCICGVIVSILLLSVVDCGFGPSVASNKKTIKLVFVASSVSMQHYGLRTKTD
jgi:hypothetical protein